MDVQEINLNDVMNQLKEINDRLTRIEELEFRKEKIQYFDEEEIKNIGKIKSSLDDIEWSY